MVGASGRTVQGGARLARVIFWVAGCYGLPLMLVMLLAERRVVGEPPVVHAEYYYGFVTVTLVFQLAFLVIGADPLRFRPMMPLAVCEKWFYVAAMIPLFVIGRAPNRMIAPVAIDAILGLAFLVAFRATKSSSGQVENIVEKTANA
jgi:hypothetical protein